MRLMTLQSTLLCLALGTNHLVAFLQDPSTHHLIHLMGIVEVLLLGGVWGVVALLRDAICFDFNGRGAGLPRLPLTKHGSLHPQHP